MSYPENIVKEKYKEATVDELANVLITLDGLGQAKKRLALTELLKRASMDDMDVWDWTHEEKVKNKA